MKKTISLYTIRSYPTAPDQQIADKIYLHDFEVIREHTVPDRAKMELLMALQDPVQRLQEANRSCRLQAKYAVVYQPNDAQTMATTYILSGAPCPKMICFEADKKNHQDLVDNSNVEKLISALVLDQ